MATINASPEFEPPPGIRLVRRRKGIGFLVSVGSGDRRRQYIFDDMRLASIFKDEAELVPDSLPPLTKHEFLAGRSSAIAVPRPRISTADLLQSIGSRLAPGYKRPEGFTFLVNVFRRFLLEAKVLDGAAESVGRLHALDLKSWLHDQNYEKPTQRSVISIARRIWGEARLCGYVDDNPFIDLVVGSAPLPVMSRKGRNRKLGRAPAWTPGQIVGIVSFLRPAYRFAFWVLVIVGDRRSEGMGLQVGDWDSTTRILEVTRQRTASPAKGTSEPKTEASVRKLILPPTLAEAVDNYIESTHGRAPKDPGDLVKWKERFLLVGEYGGPMNPQSLCDNVTAASKAIGLTPERVGSFSPLHHARASLSAELQSRVAELSGRAISDWLGHEVAAPVGDAPPSPVTRRHYSPKRLKELGAVADYIERWLQEEIVPLLGMRDLLEITSFEDGITVPEAARRLSSEGEAVTCDDVLDLIHSGQLVANMSDFIGSAGYELVLLSAAEIDELLADRIRASSDAYNTTEVAEMLGTDHRGVYRIAEQGLIVEVTVSSRARRARHGNRGGALPGGGRLWRKAEVDVLGLKWAPRLEQLRTWLKVGEAAELLGVSTDTVRRMGNRQELVIWRDEVSFRNERRVSPDSVWEALKLRDISVPEAARLLRCPQERVRAMVKLRQLTLGSRPGTIVLESVLRLVGRGDEAGPAA